MEKSKVVAILNHLLKDGEDVDDINVVDENTIEIDGDKYKVFTEEEATAEYVRFEKDLYDDLGLNFVGEEGQSYMLENFADTEWFDDNMKEDYEGFVEDMDDDEKEKEMERHDVKTDEDLVEALCNQWSDGRQWYKDSFGKDAFNNAVKENDLLNLDEAIEWLMETDGRGILSSQNGEEINLGDDLVAYWVS